MVPLVLLIWGYAIYALIGVSGGDKIVSASTFAIEMPDDLQLSADSFELNLNYKDPFLKGVKYKSESMKNNDSQVSNTNEPKSNKVIQQTTWPKLIYKGTIKNKASNKLIAILEINGNEALLKEGEKYLEVDLMKILQDSVYLAYQNERKYTKKIY